MILGLLHNRRMKHQTLVMEILERMSDRIHSQFCLIVKNSNSVEEWRRLIETYDSVEGIVIFDEFVPVPRIKRQSIHPDEGFADNIYGNFTNQWVDTDNDGFYEEEEFPDNYIQDAWVCRWIPFSKDYSDHWWASFIGRKTYRQKLLDWKKKMLRSKINPMHSAVSVVDLTGRLSGEVETWKANESAFTSFGEYYGEIRDVKVAPRYNERTKHYLQSKHLGTMHFLGHSNSTQIGDFAGWMIFEDLNHHAGPVVVAADACSVGEWKPEKKFHLYDLRNSTVSGNLLNSKKESNVTVAILSSLVQYGMRTSGFSFAKGSFFDAMGSSKYIGEALKKWVQIGVERHKGKKEFQVQAVAMSLFGDGTLQLIKET